MGSPPKQFPDPLVRQRLYPEPDKVFDFVTVSVEDAIKDGIVAVDTNVLLLPFMTGKQSLEQIRNTYKALASQGRLRIPGQVAREFAEHRAEKLKALYQQLSKKRNLNFGRSNYPLLEGIEGYTELTKCEERLEEGLRAYCCAIDSLLNVVEGWHWDDPVSKIYRDVFDPSTLVDPTFDDAKLLEDLAYRHDHQIPPGYKDAGNKHSGVGDLLIWKAILEIGTQEKRHLVFVSGDEKSDWRYQSDGRALYPRFELVDEYRRASGGKSFLMISFAELLKQFGAPAPVVAEVKQEEVSSSVAAGEASAINEISSIERIVFSRRATRAVRIWLSGAYPVSETQKNQGGPDFMVEGKGGKRAVFVSAIPGEVIAPIVIRVRLHRIRQRLSTVGFPVVFFLVLANQAAASLAERMTRRVLKDPESQLAVVVGWLEGDAFRDVGTIVSLH